MTRTEELENAIKEAAERIHANYLEEQARQDYLKEVRDLAPTSPHLGDSVITMEDYEDIPMSTIGTVTHILKYDGMTLTIRWATSKETTIMWDSDTSRWIRRISPSDKEEKLNLFATQLEKAIGEVRRALDHRFTIEHYLDKKSLALIYEAWIGVRKMRELITLLKNNANRT